MTPRHEKKNLDQARGSRSAFPVQTCNYFETAIDGRLPLSTADVPCYTPIATSLITRQSHLVYLRQSYIPQPSRVKNVGEMPSPRYRGGGRRREASPVQLTSLPPLRFHLMAVCVGRKKKGQSPTPYPPLPSSAMSYVLCALFPGFA